MTKPRDDLHEEEDYGQSDSPVEIIPGGEVSSFDDYVNYADDDFDLDGLDVVEAPTTSTRVALEIDTQAREYLRSTIDTVEFTPDEIGAMKKAHAWLLDETLKGEDLVHGAAEVRAAAARIVGGSLVDDMDEGAPETSPHNGQFG